MLSASVIVSPRKPSSSRIRSCITVRDRVAGREASPVTAGSARCADITTSAPASIAARNGTSSARSSLARSWATTASSWWRVEVRAAEAREVLAAGRDPRAAQAADDRRGTARATSAGSLPKERIPICGLAGLSARSQTGAYETFAPIASSSRPVARPTRSARSSSPAAPSAMLPGNGVAPPSASSCPPSWSAAISRGGALGSNRRRRPLDGRGELADLRGRSRVEEPEQRHPGGRRGREPPPDVVGQLVPVEREHQPAERVERVAGVAQPRQPLTAPVRPRTK